MEGWINPAIIGTEHLGREIMLSDVRLILLVLAVAPLVYYLLSIYCVTTYFRAKGKEKPRKPRVMPPASILKPVRGLDVEAHENFTSFCRLDYPEYELIFAVADADDPAIPVIEKLQGDFPDRSIRLVTNVPRLGANEKINNLCRLVREAKYDLVVMADSDVRVESDYLQDVVAPFEDPTVGAVTAFYRVVGGANLALCLERLESFDSAASALIARRLEGKMQFAFGWTMATTKNRLREIGGWEAMADYHSDDFELGSRIARHGYRVELMRRPVSVVSPRKKLQEFLAHQLRWSIGLRNVRPVAYAGMIFTHGLPWAIVAAFAARSHDIEVAYLLTYLVLRLGTAWTAGVRGLGDSTMAKRLWLLPLYDALNFGSWVAGLFLNKIVWRGLTYRVRNGQLVPEADGLQETRAHEVVGAK
jgi:ceramide glucosyltransferase